MSDICEDECSGEPPEPSEGEPEVWHRSEIVDCGDYVMVYESTNDDEDRGYPTSFASWELQFPSIEDAIKHTGKSRTGISGIKVEVFLNDEKI